MTLSAMAYFGLLARLHGHNDRATVLASLLYRHAGKDFATLTYRHISALCNSISKNTVMREIAALIEMGLVEQQGDLSTTARRYRVDMDRLSKLLQEPLPNVPVLPGITPIPALKELAEANFQDNRADFASSGASTYCRLLAHFRGTSAEANVIAVLLYQGADLSLVTLTYRQISALCMSASTRTVFRALGALIEMGLVEQQGDLSTTARRYRVDMDRLRELLQEPLPNVPMLPGITPIPALEELAERLQTYVSEEETS